ncbi:MAG: YidC/Oxa1 family membrane protein insertase [Roseburia sp.]|nr:YidC/Oxa1 family membrane protein insertase [Roseburia sp.]
MILLTQDDGIIIGSVAKILGFIMEAIFFVIDKIGIPNIGLAIILFTIVVNLLMMPLTIKQQKFSKLSAKMQPEIQAIQNKYKNKKDQDSQMAMQTEIQTVYAKYGVSPTGSCAYLLIQMPILFALYRVIYAIPAYVTKIGDTFRVLADKIISADGGDFIINSDISTIASNVSMYAKNIQNNLSNGIIDVLNRTSTADMATIAEHYDLSQLTFNEQLILSSDTTTGLIDTYNNFLGLSISNSPQFIIKNAIPEQAWFLVIGALLIPVLSAVTQWINVKLMPQQPKSGNDQADSMASSMKTMNMIMPLFSAWLCFSMPSGMGLYWVAGSIVRSIQQILINKHIDKMDFEDIIQKNKEKSQKKLEKMKANQEKLNAYANMNTRNIQSDVMRNRMNSTSGVTEEEREETIKKSTDYYNNKAAKPGSMMAKANMVKQYNEKNNK